MTPRFELNGDIETGAASRLAGFLSASAGAVALYINSPGGDAMEGAALMAEVERHGAVTVHVQGIAASAATLPMVAAREVIIHPAAMVMIHEPSCWGGGTADELRDVAAALDKMSVTYAEAYARHTGHPVARVAAWMKAETWLTAAEAVELRFADRIEKSQSPQMAAAYDYTKFRQPPDGLLRLARQYGWVSDTPASQSKGEQNAA